MNEVWRAQATIVSIAFSLLANSSLSLNSFCFLSAVLIFATLYRKFREEISYIRGVAEKSWKPNTGVQITPRNYFTTEYNSQNTSVSVNEIRLITWYLIVRNITIRALLSKVIRIFFGFVLLRFVIGLRISRPFLIQSGLSEVKPIATSAVSDGYSMRSSRFDSGVRSFVRSLAFSFVHSTVRPSVSSFTFPFVGPFFSWK